MRKFWLQNLRFLLPPKEVSVRMIEGQFYLSTDDVACGLLGVIFLLAGMSAVIGQSDRQEVDSIQADTIAYLYKLDNEWVNQEGDVLTIPFEQRVNRASQVILTHEIQLNCIPEDTVWLHFERIAWRVEVIWDDWYLGVYEQPFSTLKIPVVDDWLKKDRHQLKLILGYGEGQYLYPEPVVGVWGNAYVLESGEMNRLKNTLSLVNAYSLKAPTVYYRNRMGEKRIRHPETIALIAPYFQSSGYSFYEAEARQYFDLLGEQKISHVFFPFTPPTEMYALCKAYHIYVVDSLSGESQLAWINEYPYDHQFFPFPHSFWLDIKGHRTPSIGNVMANPPTQSTNPYQRYRFLFACLAIFPFISLLFIKLSNPTLFLSLQNLLMKPKLFVDTFSDFSYANVGVLFFLSLIRLLSLGIAWALFVYYVQVENQWHVFTFIRDISLVRSLFEGLESPWAMLSLAILCLSFWIMIKYFLLASLGLIFQIKEFMVGITSLDIVSAYPIVLFLGTIELMFILSPDLWEKSLVIFFIGTLAFYFLRRIYVYHVGLSRLFSFSSRVKFLYICTFNILPYIIWL